MTEKELETLLAGVTTPAEAWARLGGRPTDVARRQFRGKPRDWGYSDEAQAARELECAVEEILGRRAAIVAAAAKKAAAAEAEAFAAEWAGRPFSEAEAEASRRGYDVTEHVSFAHRSVREGDSPFWDAERLMIVEREIRVRGELSLRCTTSGVTGRASDSRDLDPERRDG